VARENLEEEGRGSTSSQSASSTLLILLVLLDLERSVHVRDDNHGALAQTTAQVNEVGCNASVVILHMHDAGLAWDHGSALVLPLELDFRQLRCNLPCR
jgi:hypothetical protein